MATLTLRLVKGSELTWAEVDDNFVQLNDNKLERSSNLSDLISTADARTNIGLGNVDNTSDAAKPISTATQNALNLKAPLNNPTFTGSLTAGSATLKEWTSANTDIDALIPGSTFGAILESPINAHFVIGINGNDLNDGVYIIDTNNVAPAAYSQLVLAVSNSTLAYKGNTVWHAGNDGAGSTLDADLLDGQEGSYYLDWTNVTNKPDPVVTVTLTGDVTGTGNATLTDLASGTISFATTIAANSVALGTDTTGAYVADVVAGTGVSLSETANNAEGNVVTVNIGQAVGTTSNVTFNSVTLGSEPTQGSHATTKTYVDSVAQGLHTHDSCNAVTTGTLTSISGGTVTYNNGTGGVGATLTTTGSYTTIDGVTLTNGMRILVKNEANAAHNGIYDRTSSTVLTRSGDFDTTIEMAGGDFTFVNGGTLYDNTGWVMTDPVTTVGTTAVNWVQFSGAGTYIAGNGLTQTGSTFDVVGTSNRITVAADSVDIASTYVGQSSITTVGTISSGTWSASFGAVSGANLTSLTAANISSGNLGSGVLPYSTVSSTASAFKIPFLNTTGTASGNFGLLHDTEATLTYNPSTNTLVAGTFSGALDWANVTNKPDPVITLGGDLTGSVTLTDLGSGTLTATIAANSVALGTDTTGNYVGTGAVSGNGLSGSATGEGSTFTVTSNATSADTANTIVFRDASGDFSAGAITVSGPITRLTGNGNTSWLQQDGNGRVHWYWNTYGTTSPTFTNAGEDASAITQSVSNGGAGGRILFRSASGVGKLAGDPITWTTTLYTDLNTFTYKGDKIWHAGNDGDGSGLDADLLDGQEGSYYLDWTNVTNKPDPVITLGGDLTGSVTLTDLGSGTLTATIAANSVALGTDTTGNYVASMTAGTGITVGTATGEGSTPVITNTAPNVTTDLSTTTTSTTLTVVSSDGTNALLPAATTTVAGVMTGADKTKLDGIEAGANAYVLPVSTTAVLGGIKLEDDTVQSTAANTVTTTASRTYGLQVNASGQGVMNVPWTNTTYSAGNGITLTSTTFSVAAGTGLTQDAGGLSHSDTSTLTGAQGGSGIASITVDGMGHVTAVSTATYLTAESDTWATVTSRGATSNSSVGLPSGENVAYGFWGGTTSYSIAMGITAGTYQYGPVTDYSIKMNMGAGAGRGFTWGQYGAKPIAALNSTSGDMTIAGSFQAASKSFLINHPTKPGMKLRYGSLEGPEHGVYIRGKIKGNVIELPDYWTELVHKDSITVQLTPIGKHQKLYVKDIRDNKVYIANDGLFAGEVNCFYFVQAERIDVKKLDVEIY